jgi:ligand-binding sensor domain-containing protein
VQNDTVVWLSSAKGLIELNPASGHYKNYDKRTGEPVLEMRYAAISPQGLLWVGTGGYGVYTFDMRSKKFVDNFRNDVLDPFSVCSNNIVSLYFDKVEDVWCGSYGNGASYANVETNFFSKHLSKTELDPWKKENNIFWIGEDKRGKFLVSAPGCTRALAPGFLVENKRLPTSSLRKRNSSERFHLPIAFL